jgi:excinuclease ABC subunit A
MGPEGGDGGGLLLAEEPPETVAGLEQSYTGRYLGRFFKKPIDLLGK